MVILLQRLRSAMPAAAVAAATMATAEASHVASAAKAARMATSETSTVLPAKGAWMAVHVMVLPGMVVCEVRSISSSIVRPSIGVGGIAIARRIVVTISSRSLRKGFD
jgi:ABC-type protease/lipase transport system fused ATPase/permease subunit